MHWEALWQGVALAFVIEGLLPFISPRQFRRVYEQALQLSDRHLRVLALISMFGGLLMLATVA
jgi:uncharacterized protein